tara:strand:+ start:797 stop:1045 length:249 start_codon:yes stop_codon:yes gene_type:complete
MKRKSVKIEWPDGSHSINEEGSSWLGAALSAGVEIPTGCLVGSCGACEIDVNGKVIRACISNIRNNESKEILKVDFSSDPYW